MKARVNHNVAVDDGGHHLGFLDGYQPGHPVTLVFSTEAPDCEDLDACEQLYRLLNVDDDPDFGEPDPRAKAYRARGNRSLSFPRNRPCCGWPCCRAGAHVLGLP